MRPITAQKSKWLRKTFCREDAQGFPFPFSRPRPSPLLFLIFLAPGFLPVSLPVEALGFRGCRERGARAESKNCEILLFPTADRRFDTKVKCPTGRASFWVKFLTVRALPGGKGMGGFGIDWYIN